VAGLPAAARAQQTARMRRIGVLLGAAETDPDAQRRLAAFRKAIYNLGWAEGGSIQIEVRFAAGDEGLRRRYAAELVGAAPDTIVTVGTPGLRLLSRETSAIPIVFLSVSDPVGLGFVASLAHPGGNVTGFANFEPAIGGKWLQLLKEIAPNVTRAALVFNPETAPFGQAILHSLESAAPALAMNVASAAVRDAAELDRTIDAIGRELGRGLIVAPDDFTVRNRAEIVALAARYRLPAIYPLREFTAEGGLMAYGIDLIEQSREAAVYVDRILRGAAVGDLPVQAPTKFELLINVKTAKALGLAVPPSLLARADEVIE
jgi:putative ABC transport system substrate-binding protein